MKLIFAGSDARDYLAVGDFGIDHGLATTSAIVDRNNKILHRDPALFRGRGPALSEGRFDCADTALVWRV
jgi:hypothetical protein